MNVDKLFCQRSLYECCWCELRRVGGDYVWIEANTYKQNEEGWSTMEGLLVGRNHLLAKEVRRSSLQEIFTDVWIKVDNVEPDGDDSSVMKLNFNLLCPLNQVNTKSVFLHWLTFVNDLLNNLGHDIISQYDCFI